MMIGYSIAVVVLAIMLMVGGIVYSIGIASDIRKLKDFGKDEILQTAINGVIVGTLIIALSQGGAISTVINGIVLNVSHGISCPAFNSNYAICFANNYLVGTTINIKGSRFPSLLDAALELLIPTATAYGIIGTFSSVSLSVGLASISFKAIFSPILTEETYIISALTFSIISIYIQSALLEVISIITLPLLLPTGIILRTFYPTRKLGGSIIALSIGLFLIFPLTYLLDAQIAYNYSNVTAATSAASILTYSKSISSNIFSMNRNSSISTYMSGTLNIASNFFSMFLTMISSILKAVALLVIEVFFMPAFSIILTAISTREFAKLLGSEISFGKFDIF